MARMAAVPDRNEFLLAGHALLEAIEAVAAVAEVVHGIDPIAPLP
jgi:hypothetical protein